EGGGVGEGRVTETANSPTFTLIGTKEGVLLGTAAYMSPEQARGQFVDKQTDIWAFGCVLYEMLTGTNAFAGATTTDTLAAIVEREPNWARLPAATPPTVLSMLRRCLQKDPMRRLRDIADARFQIEEALSEPLSAVDVGTPVPSRRTPERLLWVTALVAAVVA